MKISKLKTIAAFTLIALLLFALPRIPGLADPIEKELLKELRDATGMDFSIESVTLSLLPPYAQVEGLIGTDSSKVVSLKIKKAKAYISIMRLINREVSINRLILKDSVLTGEKKVLDKITESVKEYLSKDTEKPIKVVVKSIEIESGSVSISNGDDRLSIDSINLFAKPSGDVSARLFLSDLRIQTEQIKDLSANLAAHLYIHGEGINISNLSLNFFKSRVKTSGTIDKNKLEGPLELQIKLLWDSLKRVFGLKNDGTGWIESRGKININGKKPLLDAIDLDLSLQGEFFIETLMELLKVREPLKGYIGVNGSVKGPLRDLEGNGDAHLKDGDIFDVAVDSLFCNVHYRDGAMRFTDGKASLYKGKADVNVMIALPVVNYFEVDVSVKDISSRGLFNLIKWDPGIAEGKVTGSLLSKGKVFNPSGIFTYRNDNLGSDILSRIKQIEARYAIYSEILTLTDLNLRSPQSQITAKGDIDIRKGVLNLTGKGASSDIKELPSPYFTALSGKAGFDFLLKGTLDDPMIDMQFRSTEGRFDTTELSMKGLLGNNSVTIKDSSGDMLYRKNLLTVRQLTFATDRGNISAKGNIHFKNAKALFDLRSPLYDLHFDIDNGDIKAISGLFKDSPEMSGLIKGSFTLTGTPARLESEASFSALKYRIGSYSLGDTLSSSVSYKDGTFVFSDTILSIGKNEIRGKGSLSLNKDFTLKAEGKTLSISNIKGELTDAIKAMSLNNLSIKGQGRIDKPYIEASSAIILSGPGSRYTIMGDARLKLDDKEVTLQSSMLDKKMLIHGKASTEGNMPWQLKAELKTTRYDFLISGFLKNLPEDLVLNLNGNIDAWGDKDNISGTAVFDRAYLHLYGNGFSNKGDIRISINKNNVTLNNLALFNDNAELKAGGSLVIGKRYDLLFEGISSLSPFKAFSASLDALKGDARFVVSVSGDWNEPKINGGVDIYNGSIGLKDLYYRATSLNAYIYFDEDRVVISKASARVAGGDITIKGNANLKRFKIDRFFLETQIENATLSPSKDFWINFGGNLFVRGNLNSQQILGDIKINKGRYTDRIDWKSWIMGASKIEKPRVESGRLDRVSINVKAVGSSIQVDNNLSRSTLTMDLLLRGTLNNPIPIGKVEVREGTVFFRNNEFRIMKATLDFANPEQAKPYFNIVADTKVQNYNIRLTLEGFTEHFNLSLSSDPYLPETDIFALLTVGQTGKQIKGMEAGIGAGEAASFLTGKIQDIFEERAKSITGFDRIQLDPAISKTTSTVSPRITVSKRLMGDKLYVTYSASITSGEEQVWKLEYMLDRKTSLIGVRDERGGLGADIKFRFEFK